MKNGLMTMSSYGNIDHVLIMAHMANAEYIHIYNLLIHIFHNQNPFWLVKPHYIYIYIYSISWRLILHIT